MARYKLENNATEKSTYVITCEFEDENGDAITPGTLTWTLTDTKGRIINSREDVSVSDPTSSEDIVLYGDDLALSQNDNRIRVFTVYATWSGTYGSSLPLRNECEFKIDNLLKVT